MAKVYTKTGDKGETSLVGGSRVSKADSQIELYGEVDHLNSMLGTALCHLEDKELSAVLTDVQHKLFDLGSLLACEVDKRETFKLPSIHPESVLKLEIEIDRMEKSLEPLKQFILPGGSKGASFLHQCRTQARRVERKLIDREDLAPENSREFLNRLSDYFFVAARYQNFLLGVEDIKWNPTKA